MKMKLEIMYLGDIVCFVKNQQMKTVNVLVECKNVNLRSQLEDVFKAMLAVWAKETEAFTFVSGIPDG